jgi:hypothetical protein
MNDDELEKKLLALTGALRRPDPTPAWKADILARAHREAQAIPLSPIAPPRWLMLSWAAAWAAILALGLTIPHDATRDTQASSAASHPPSAGGRNPSPQTLFAFHQGMKLNLDLP